jgi:MFS family permease
VEAAAARFNPSVSRPRGLLPALRVAVRNDDIRRVELAWGGAIAAEWAHFVALGVFAYQRGGVSSVGLAGLVRLLPAAAVAPFAASLGDRFRRERFLLAMLVLGSVALAGSAAAAFAGSRVGVFACAALFGVSTTLIRPALQALLPSLARTPTELIASNGATSTLESLGSLVGPLFAGLAIASSGVGAVFVGGAGLLAAAAVALLRVRVHRDAVRIAPATRETAREAIASGFRPMLQEPKARLLFGLAVAQTFVRGCLNVLIVVAAFRLFRGSAADVGYLTTAIGVGGLFGALGATAIRARRLAVSFGLALLLWGLPIALVAPWPRFAAALALLAVVGAANSVEDVALLTLFQRTVPDDVLTRALGLFWGLAMGGVAVGSIVAPAVVAALGPRSAFVLVGSLLPILVLLTFRRLIPIDSDAAPAPELELVAQVPIFAPLSLAAKERVAHQLVPVAVPAGEVVIRAGDVGDRFYILQEGAVEIDAGTMQLTASPGDCFGEIALMRDVPRTATVTATVDSRLQALGRDAFLSAVTGHPASLAAGQQLAEARLEEAAHARVPQSARTSQPR